VGYINKLSLEAGRELIKIYFYHYFQVVKEIADPDYNGYELY